VTEAATAGVDLVMSSVTYTLAVNVENLTLTGTVAINANGNTAANTLTGNAAKNILNGGKGADTMAGGAGNDTYAIDNAGDIVTESASQGTDTVKSSITYTLASQVENLRLTGSAAIDGTGNTLNNYLYGNTAANHLAGGAGNDRFVLDSLLASDTISDFLSGADRLQVSMAAIAVGDGDTVVEGAVTRSAPGGFTTSAEVVLMTTNLVGTIDSGKAAGAIGSASSKYAVGQHALFMVDNGSDSALYYFSALDADAAVEANELTLLASLTGTASTVTADLIFGG
jgi:Ca2+-binding RTX toxin-like protein